MQYILKGFKALQNKGILMQRKVEDLIVFKYNVGVFIFHIAFYNCYYLFKTFFITYFIYLNFFLFSN